jgi:hypothetical protein
VTFVSPKTSGRRHQRDEAADIRTAASVRRGPDPVFREKYGRRHLMGHSSMHPAAVHSSSSDFVLHSPWPDGAAHPGSTSHPSSRNGVACRRVHCNARNSHQTAHAEHWHAKGAAPTRLVRPLPIVRRAASRQVIKLAARMPQAPRLPSPWWELSRRCYGRQILRPGVSSRLNDRSGAA